MIVPAKVRGADERHACFDKPSSQQQPLAELGLAVALASLRVLAIQVEGRSRLRRGDKVIRLGGELIDGLASIRLARLPKGFVDTLEQLASALESILGDVLGRSK